MSPVPNRLDPNDSYTMTTMTHRARSAMSDTGLSRSTPHLARSMPHSTSPSPSRVKNTRSRNSPSPSPRPTSRSSPRIRTIPRPNNDDINFKKQPNKQPVGNTGRTKSNERKLKSARSTSNLTRSSNEPYSDPRKRLKMRKTAKKVRQHYSSHN